MLLKWSQEQDQELHRVIRRHGTSNWALIRKHFKGNRSRDSVIKRWHGKLKFQKYVPIPEKTKKISNDRKKQPQRKKAAVNRRAAPKATKKPENAQPGKPMKGINVRSQRLRSMIENSEPKKGKDKQAAPVEPIQSVQQTEKASERPMEEEGPGFPWSRAEDERLLGLVLKEGIFNWGRLGSRMGCSQKEAKDRWRKSIYDLIKLDDKVGGFLKYSAEEDAILTNGFRSSLTWGELMDFLPGRSEFSIEARWRRLLRPELEVELSKNKHYIVRQFLKRVVERRQGEHALVEEPALSEPSSPKHP